MADNVHFREVFQNLGRALAKGIEHLPRSGVAGIGIHRLVSGFSPGGFYPEARVLERPFPFQVGFPNRSRRRFRKRLADVVEAAFLAAGPCIKHQDFHAITVPLL